MPDIVIKAENLGKKYIIGHQSENGRYVALRDVMMQNAQGLWHKAKDLLRGKPIILGDTLEEFWALKDVSFEIQRGEAVGIIGRNGAGKSTLLKILSRITEPSAGRVTIKGRVASLLEVGTGFHPELTGRENIYLNGAILGMSRAEIKRKFDEIVAFAEVEKFLDTPVKRYSSGMYVRLAFAVAAHLEPEIMVVDEVLAVGDAAFQKKCLGKMGEVASEGRTVLFVSHNMGAIQQLCARAMLIRSGSLLMEGRTDQVVRHYLSDAHADGSGVFDVSGDVRHTGRCQGLIKEIRLTGSDGLASNRFLPRESMQIALSIDPPHAIKNPKVAVSIEDQFGRRLMTFGSHFQRQGLQDIEGPTMVTCSIPELTLGEGDYLLSASVATRIDGLLDSLDGVARFHVGWYDSFGNGEPFYSVYGPVLTNSVWVISPFPVLAL
jgi:lipopolysaccharide transport system ATP-binding protein